MAYDNTKMDAAINRWIKKNCIEGFGETYAGDLLKSFDDYCAKTGSLKRSPGRVVFGMALARRNYEKRKVCGLVYWAGLLLKAPPGVTAPRENAKSSDTLRVKQHRERMDKKEELAKEQAAERESRAARVRARMAGESKKNNQAAGLSKPD